MPRTNAHTALELPKTDKVDPAFQRALNRSFLEISRQLDSLGAGSGARSVRASGSGGVTVVGSELVLSKPGMLAIEDNVFPLVSLPGDATPSAIIGLVKRAPVGGDIKVLLQVDGEDYFTLTIPENQTEATQTGGFSAIGADLLVTGDITSVGITTVPGADLTLIVRF